MALALWGVSLKRDGTFTLCQMAYTEVFLGKQVNWLTYPQTASKGHRKLQLSQIIPPNDNVLLDEDASVSD